MSNPISIAPHLEKALELMSKDMAVAPEALVNQAVFAWLRMNGYVAPSVAPSASVSAPAPAPVVAPPPVGAVAPPASPSLADAPAPTATAASQRNLAPVESAPSAKAASQSQRGLPPVESAPGAKAPSQRGLPEVAPAPNPRPAPEAPPVASSPSGGARAELEAAVARMKEIDADLEKLAKPWPAWTPQPVEEEEDEPESEEDEDAPEEEVDEGAEEEGAEEEQGAEEEEAPPPDDEDEPAAENTGETEVAPPEPDEEEPPPESTIVLKSMPIVLYVQRGDEEPIRVTEDRFIIGRGPHCDLVIDSPRVSREHVALTRSGIMYFIEDLNSSNGTWFNEERVTKKELESGDVIHLGNEPVTFILRGE